MPRKPNKSSWGGRGGRSGKPVDKEYFGHDDRVPRNDRSSYIGSRPRVSFKTQARPTRDITRSLALACLDDDVQMATSSNNYNRRVIVRGRDRGTHRGRNSPLPHRGFRGSQIPLRLRQIPLGEQIWYKIVIPYGQKYDKDYVLNNLSSYIAPETFVPIMYKIGANESSFYVDDKKIAITLLNCDRKITTTDGFKLQVRVSKQGFPQCDVDDKLKERLKQAMAKRYVHETKALDLSKFHQDPDLVTDYFCGLFRPGIMKVIMDIVLEHIPNLEALNLDGNKLWLIDKISVVIKKFPNLKILYIGDNRIKEITQLDTIKELKLVELKLAGNPVCNKYKSRQSDYIRANVSVITINLELPGFWLFFPDHSDVRKRFPKLLRLDGVELPKPILFDVADEGNKMPQSQRMFVANAKAQEIASQFLQQYFVIFDSDNRQPLLDAYDEHACFSMTVSNTQNGSKTNAISDEYLSRNRNLYRINEQHKRQKLLKHGRLPVVSFISELPQMRHCLNTFTMDISLVTEVMMMITVTGLFKELENKGERVYYFNRTFIIVPEGSGYCIRNEQLHISNPTDAQLKQLNSQPAPPQMADSAPRPLLNNTAVKATPTQLPADVKQQMTLTLSQQTNMNLEWSLKCLEEVQWNYDNALSAFQEFFKRGQIPSEAFNK